MKRHFQLIAFVLASIGSSMSYANWYQDIINAINAQGVVTNYWLSNSYYQQGQILSSQQNIDSLMRQVNSHLTGNSGWGNYQFHDYQSYGEGGRTWASVMQSADAGKGTGEFGQVIAEISSQFPNDKYYFNKAIKDPNQQKYYALKYQTILAIRAASQLDYNKIQDQIAYQQMLQQQIERTQSLKSAVDLNNRIQVEGNLINLEILRQAALTNQEKAVTEQATINTAVSNAKFLTKE